MPFPPGLAAVRRLLRPNEWTLLAAIVVTVLITGLVDTQHTYWFRPFDSVRDIARNTALLGIFALGATVVIIAGGIDLSSGSMIAFSGTVAACTMVALAPAEVAGFKPVGPVVVGIACLASLLAAGYMLSHDSVGDRGQAVARARSIREPSSVSTAR